MSVNKYAYLTGQQNWTINIYYLGRVMLCFPLFYLWWNGNWIQVLSEM